MTRVFIAGSRQISRWPAEVRSRIDRMVERGLQILVGDANGADKAVQRCLSGKQYRNVLVHCMEDRCRNNVGDWPIHSVTSAGGARGFDYYATKDRVMADAADYGLMLWDGKSKGTINNVVNLSRGSKIVVVYVAPTKAFLTVRTPEDLQGLLSQGDPPSVERLVEALHLDVPQQRAAG